MSAHPDIGRFFALGLNRDTAAAFIGVDLERFDELVVLGRLPKPIRIDEFLVWDRLSLEAHANDLSLGEVYFVLSPTIGFLKIGFASNTERRISSLQIGSADNLIVVATIQGDIAKERSLHRRFSAYREHGEWFRYEGALRKYVESL